MLFIAILISRSVIVIRIIIIIIIVIIIIIIIIIINNGSVLDYHLIFTLRCGPYEKGEEPQTLRCAIWAVNW